jgi:acyl-CoA synthetase (AMP-forming)/AMP-acid ligase II
LAGKSPFRKYLRSCCHAGIDARPSVADFVTDRICRTPPWRGEIVSRRVEGDLHRYTYKEVAPRARQVANALDGMKLGFSDRVATLAWNGYRHLELYFGVSGSGRVLHTLNPRLHPDQIAWIANHAEDTVLCFDMSFLPIVKAIQGKATTIRHWVALCDADKLPADSGIPGC